MEQNVEEIEHLSGFCMGICFVCRCGVINHQEVKFFEHPPGI
jgi:hypothetical protein